MMKLVGSCVSGKRSRRQSAKMRQTEVRNMPDPGQEREALTKRPFRRVRDVFIGPWRAETERNALEVENVELLAALAARKEPPSGVEVDLHNALLEINMDWSDWGEAEALARVLQIADDALKGRPQYPLAAHEEPQSNRKLPPNLQVLIGDSYTIHRRRRWREQSSLTGSLDTSTTTLRAKRSSVTTRASSEDSRPLSLDNALWNEIMPDKAGILCASCFTRRCESQGVGIGWRAGRVGDVEALVAAREDTERPEVPEPPCVLCGTTEELPSGDCRYCSEQEREDEHPCWHETAKMAEQSLRELRQGMVELGFIVGCNPDGVDDTVASTLLIVREHIEHLEEPKGRLREAFEAGAASEGTGTPLDFTDWVGGVS